MGKRRDDVYERAQELTKKLSDDAILPELKPGGEGLRDSNVLIDHKYVINQLVNEFEINRGTAAGAVVRVIKARRQARAIKLTLEACPCEVEIYVPTIVHLRGETE